MSDSCLVEETDKHWERQSAMPLVEATVLYSVQ